MGAGWQRWWRGGAYERALAEERRASRRRERDEIAADAVSVYWVMYGKVIVPSAVFFTSPLTPTGRHRCG